ncbi:hypothetical protein [Escherichia marmotae]|uniref:hypothetical protein n=1 Tax=Escherichia marmotae TaxID=1499973 RepID=UPI00056EB0FC|nr:hypothetical protein [Escherichia marmotae]AUT29399.1 hypothetical protein C1192_21525 [Escherichia marmotae]
MRLNEEFISCIFNELLIDDFELYKKNIDNIIDDLDSISKVDIDKSTYKKFSKIMSTLNDQEQSVVYDFLKLIISDTASVIFGAIDGTHFVKGLDKNCLLNYGGEDIQGDLQDLFLEKFENEIHLD